MGKKAFLFPGQGAQYSGMGLELYENYSVVSETLNAIDSLLNFNLLDIIFNGPEEELKKTENTQPAIYAISIAVLRLLEQNGIYADAAVGLSLGEYSALTASHVLNYDDALPLVRLRGKYMQEAVPDGVGTMAAIIGMDRSMLQNILKIASKVGVVEAVNYNCPGQIAIAGEILAVERAVEIAKENGAVRSLILKVSAPFHSSMLKPAGICLNNELKKIRFSASSIPVLANVDGDYYKFDKEEIIDKLTRQVYSPVLFEDSIIKLLDSGFDTFVEVGPGRALSGFIKRISKNAKIFNVEDIKSLEKTILGLSAQ